MCVDAPQGGSADDEVKSKCIRVAPRLPRECSARLPCIDKCGRNLTLDICSTNRYVQVAVRKLSQVEDAKALMREAVNWSVFKWLFEKRRVRKTAEEANAALDKLNHDIKSRWKREIATAYENLAANHGRSGRARRDAADCDPEILLFAKQVKDADDAAHRARMTAENTFNEAARRLSTDLAREACRQAIHSWELHEKAIGIAETALDFKLKH